MSLLLPLDQMCRASSVVTKLSRLGAEFWYTLYLVHFPIAVQSSDKVYNGLTDCR